MDKVFVIHSRHDREWVERTLVCCVQHGLHVTFSTEPAATAQAFEETVVKELKAADRLVVVMSRLAQASDWVQDEVFWAMKNKPEQTIGVMLEDCSPERFHLGFSRVKLLISKLPLLPVCFCL